MNKPLEYHLSCSVFTGLYSATLLGGEFGNCHGQGSTPEGAVASLKIRVEQLRQGAKFAKMIDRRKRVLSFLNEEQRTRALIILSKSLDDIITIN